MSYLLDANACIRYLNGRSQQLIQMQRERTVPSEPGSNKRARRLVPMT